MHVAFYQLAVGNLGRFMTKTEHAPFLTDVANHNETLSLHEMLMSYDQSMPFNQSFSVHGYLL